MAWKHYIRRNVSAALVILVAISVTGCASRRQSKSADASVNNVTLHRLPAVSVSGDSSSLSGIASSSPSVSTAGTSTDNPGSVDYASGLGPRRSTYRSPSPSQRGCSTGGCGKCGT